MYGGCKAIIMFLVSPCKKPAHRAFSTLQLRNNVFRDLALVKFVILIVNSSN